MKAISSSVKSIFIQSTLSLSMAFLTLAPSLFAEHFPWNPPNNFTVQPKYIALHHPVATSNPTAQQYFDQGLTFLYAFNHDAAYWSFLRASEVDPNMAMAYWGMAISLGANINMDITPERARAAYELTQKALQKAERGPEVERDYIQALARRYSKDPKADQSALAKSYRDAMEQLTIKYPDDPDAAVLYAESILDVNPWNQWSEDGKPLNGTMTAVKTLQTVLKNWPDHLGANHYYVHVVEASQHPEIGLMSAERLKTLLPSSGHILHMPSHIYLLVGDIEQAIKSNIEAVAADREYIRQYGMDGIYPLHYLSHNLYFLTRSYILAGRFKEALQTANELTEFYSSRYRQMEDLEYYASAPLTVLIAFHRWNEILEQPAPNEQMKVITALWHYGRALAYAHLGNIPQALKEQRLFLDKKSQLSAQQAFGYNTANQILLIAQYTLAARIAENQRNFDLAVKELNNAVALQDSLRYNEPPDWFFPSRESLGALFLRMNQPGRAEEIFRRELKRYPRNGRALFGLRESLKDQGKEVDAYWVNEEFQRAWKNSTSSLSVKDL